MNKDYINKFRNLSDRALATARLIRERQVEKETKNTTRKSTEENTHGRNDKKST